MAPEFDDTASNSNQEDTNSKSNVTEGSSNDNFKKSFGSRIKNTAASSAASTATRAAMGATFGLTALTRAVLVSCENDCKEQIIEGFCC